jgi:hypothetical protein
MLHMTYVPYRTCTIHCTVHFVGNRFYNLYKKHFETAGDQTRWIKTSILEAKINTEQNMDPEHWISFTDRRLPTSHFGGDAVRFETICFALCGSGSVCLGLPDPDLSCIKKQEK